MVAVHGFNGHYTRTWSGVVDSSKTGFATAIPKHVPNARVMSFGYCSNPRMNKSPALLDETGFRYFARKFLEEVHKAREEGDEVGISFLRTFGSWI